MEVDGSPFRAVSLSISWWLVGAVRRRFWVDNWLGHILEGHVQLMQALQLPKVWNYWMNYQMSLLPTSTWKLREIALAPDRPDRLIFTPNDRGDFSLKSFLERARPAGVERRWSRLVWNPHSLRTLKLFYGNYSVMPCRWIVAFRRGVLTWLLAADVVEFSILNL